MSLRKRVAALEAKQASDYIINSHVSRPASGDFDELTQEIALLKRKYNKLVEHVNELNSGLGVCADVLINSHQLAVAELEANKVLSKFSGTPESGADSE